MLRREFIYVLRHINPLKVPKINLRSGPINFRKVGEKPKLPSTLAEMLQGNVDN